MFFILHSNKCGHSMPHHGHSHDRNHNHSHDDESLIVDVISGHSHEEISKQSTSTKNINVQAAMIHVIGDFVQSIGVLLAAILIKIKVCQNY
jgi:zinc transporter 2